MHCYFHQIKFTGRDPCTVHAHTDPAVKKKHDDMYSHQKCSRAAFDKLPLAIKYKAGNGGKGGKGIKSGGKGTPQGGSPSAQPRKPAPATNCCRQFLKDACTYGDKCKFPHKSQAEVDKMKKASGNNTPSGTPRSGKGSDKGKG